MDRTTKRMAESAVMLAIGTVLSIWTFKGPWAYGGGITVCSMLPLVILSHRYGTKWGVFCAFVYSVLQALLGVQNIQYATSFGMAVAIVLLDYTLAFSVVGLSAVFDRFFRSRPAAIVTGIAATFFLRFFCHFASGVIIWEALWPNELGWAPEIWSLAYNTSYMLPEVIITAGAALLLYMPLEKYWLAADLK